MSVVRWTPDIFALHDQMNQLFAEAAGTQVPGEGRGPRDQSWMTLPVDIHQTEEAFTIEASVPGFRPGDVEVFVEDGLLTIRGRLPADGPRRDGGWVRRERRLGSFHREIGMPSEIRADEISAEFEDGILRITVPRAQKAQPKRIPVRVTEGSATDGAPRTVSVGGDGSVQD